MKKVITIHYIAALFILLIAAACKKDSLESFPLETSFEEPDSVLASYVRKLSESASGWEFALTGKDQGFFVGYLNFESSNSAKFTVDEDLESGAIVTNIGYSFRIKESNPGVSFLPGSAYSELTTRNPGLDTSFTFKAVRGDSIFLNGDQYGSDLILTKASATKALAYQEGGIVTTMEKLGRMAALPLYFKTLIINGVNYDFYFNVTSKTLSIQYGGTQNFRIHETYFGRTATGIYLQKPLVDGINTIAYLDAFTVDAASGEMTATVNGVSLPFINQVSPGSYDETAALRFINNPPRQVTVNYSDGTSRVERYSASINGFTVAGVTDAYGVKNIAGYQYISFFHQWAGQEYGALRLILGSTSGNTLSSYGLALQPLFSTTGGLMALQYLGTFGAFPEEIIPIFQQYVNAFSAHAFFVVQSSPSSYDLVSTTAEGGQKWIRFE